MSETHVIVVGAGLGGALTACALGHMGYRVTLYERRSDPREEGFVGGRSINLALSTRGLEALKRVNLDERVLADAIPMRGRVMHDTAGNLAFQAYSKNPSECINSVSRGGLNVTLLNALNDLPNVSVVFDQKCVDADLENAIVSFECGRDENTRVDVQADVVIAADGAYSAIRRAMTRLDRFNYSQSYLEHGYKELTIPPTPEGEFAIEPNALHIWPRGGFMMIALPNADRSFTCTLFWPFDGSDASFARVNDEATIRRVFEREFPDAIPLIPDLIEDFQRNPVGSMVTVRCNPWTYAGKFALLGDAAHAIVPFYGQGMNCAFEDCRVLCESLDASDGDFARAFEEYDRVRPENAEAIADMALKNFIEMRDKVASPWFLWRKKLEKVLHRLFPGSFLPLYNMVSFSNIPYAEARERARSQARIIRSILIGCGVVAGAAVVVGVILVALASN